MPACPVPVCYPHSEMSSHRASRRSLTTTPCPVLQVTAGSERARGPRGVTRGAAGLPPGPRAPGGQSRLCPSALRLPCGPCTSWPSFLHAARRDSKASGPGPHALSWLVTTVQGAKGKLEAVCVCLLFPRSPAGKPGAGKEAGASTFSLQNSRQGSLGWPAVWLCLAPSRSRHEVSHVLGNPQSWADWGVGRPKPTHPAPPFR